MINELEYVGKLNTTYYDEGGMRVGDHTLREIIDDIEIYLGRYKEIHVSYLISDVELTKEQFLENRLLTIFGGVPKLECNDVHGSEWTGYMWTNQKFEIGGHDLIKELSTYDEQYCYLKIYNAIEKRNIAIDNVLK